MAINEPNMRLMKRDDLDAVVAIDTLVSKQERRQYYERKIDSIVTNSNNCLLYTSPSPRDRTRSRMPSSA